MAKLCACCFVAAAGISAATPEPLQIIEKTLSADRINQDVIRNYIMVEDRTERLLDERGAVKESKAMTYDVLFVEGARYSRLIRKNGRPLSPDEEKKEEKKLREFTEKRKKEIAGGDSKRANEARKYRLELLALLPQAFDFSFRAEEVVDGRPVYVIDARRKPGFKPKTKQHEVLSKIEGTLWIDKQEYQIVRADVELMDSVSLGWFIAKVGKGTRLRMEQTRINDEVWLPKRLHMNASVRLLGNMRRMDNETTMSNYRKFQSDSRVVSVTEEERD